jgi:hypothetical protein
MSTTTDFHFEYLYNSTTQLYDIAFFRNTTQINLGICTSHAQCQSLIGSHRVWCLTGYNFATSSSCACGLARTGMNCLDTAYSYYFPVIIVLSVTVIVGICTMLFASFELYKLLKLTLQSKSQSYIHAKRTLILIICASLAFSIHWTYECALLAEQSNLTEADFPTGLRRTLLIIEFAGFTISCLNIGIVWLIAAEKTLRISHSNKIHIRRYQAIIPFFSFIFFTCMAILFGLNEETGAIALSIPAFTWISLTTAYGSLEFYQIYREARKTGSSTELMGRAMLIARRIFVHGFLVSILVCLMLIFFLVEAILRYNFKRLPESPLWVMPLISFMLAPITLFVLTSYLSGVVEGVAQKNSAAAVGTGTSNINHPNNNNHDNINNNQQGNKASTAVMAVGKHDIIMDGSDKQ